MGIFGAYPKDHPIWHSIAGQLPSAKTSLVDVFGEDRAEIMLAKCREIVGHGDITVTAEFDTCMLMGDTLSVWISAGGMRGRHGFAFSNPWPYETLEDKAFAAITGMATEGFAG